MIKTQLHAWLFVAVILASIFGIQFMLGQWL